MPKIGFIKELIAQHCSHGMQFRRADREFFVAKILDAGKIADKFGTQLLNIKEDTRLTGEGKRDSRTAAGRSALDELGKWRDPILAGLDRHEESLLGKLRQTVTLPPADAGERMERALIRSEIRAQARGLDAQQREILYRVGDRVVRDALDETPFIVTTEGMPRIENFITPEIRADVILDEAQSRMPEEADLLDDVRNQREIAEIIGNHIEKAIHADAPGSAPDALSDALKVS